VGVAVASDDVAVCAGLALETIGVAEGARVPLLLLLPLFAPARLGEAFAVLLLLQVSVVGSVQLPTLPSYVQLPSPLSLLLPLLLSGLSFDACVALAGAIFPT